MNGILNLLVVFKAEKIANKWYLSGIEQQNNKSI